MRLAVPPVDSQWKKLRMTVEKTGMRKVFWENLNRSLPR
jgi:hypothetical protein